jgi:hypothetical protein
MSTINVRVRPENYQWLREMAEQRGVAMPVILSEAIEQHYRKWLLQGLNDDYARLRADPKAWAEELKERELWDQTLADGLEDL